MFWLMLIYWDLRKTAFKVHNFDLQSPQIQQYINDALLQDPTIFANVFKYMPLFTIFEWFRVLF